MSDSTSTDHSNRVEQALCLRWPVAVVIVLFTVSYPANDFEGANSPWHHHGEDDTSATMLMVYAAIALITAIVVFALLIDQRDHLRAHDRKLDTAARLSHGRGLRWTEFRAGKRPARAVSP